MKLLLTNDDGIHAPGLEALRQAVAELGATVVVAPCEELSGCGHRVTTDRHLRITPHGDDRHAVDGTPADCTRVGLIHVSPEVDWVMAGINAGGNLGVDVYMSGTVAAVREAAMLGKPAIAISQYRRRGRPVDWQRAARWTRHVVGELLAKPHEPGTFWNVNLPDGDALQDSPPLAFCHVDPNAIPVAYREESGGLAYHGRYEERARTPRHDVDHCFSGRIAVSRIRLGGSVDVV